MNAAPRGLGRLAWAVCLWVLLVSLLGESAAIADPRIRKDQKAATQKERDAFVAALLKVKANGSYNRFVEDHKKAFDRATFPINPAHGGAAFLPWHRKFLWELETLVLNADHKSVSGTGLLKGLLYWDWTEERDKTKGPFTDDFMGGDGNPADNDIAQKGPFGKDNGKWKLFDGGGFLQRSIGTLTLDGTAQPIGLPTKIEVTNALKVGTYDVSPWNRNSNGTMSFRNHLEGFLPGGLHNVVHVWVGGQATKTVGPPPRVKQGTLAKSTSPDDPIFFLHHTQVDKIWAIWQEIYGRDKYPVAGAAGVPIPDGHKLDDVMRIVGSTPKDMLDIMGTNLGYQYEVGTGWKVGVAGSWSDKAKWDIKDNWLLDKFANNDDRLLWNVTLPLGGMEIKQDVEALTINRLQNIASKLVLEKEMTVKGDVINVLPSSIIDASKKMTVEGELINFGTLVNKDHIKAKRIVNVLNAKLDPAIFEITGEDPEDAFYNDPTGILEGAGTVVGSVLNHGLINPGTLDSTTLTETGTGTIDVIGSYEQFADGLLLIDIEGEGSTEHDRLAISGDGTFGAEVLIHFGFEPEPGQMFGGLITVGGMDHGPFPTDIHITGLKPGFPHRVEFDDAGSFNLLSTGFGMAAVPKLATSPDAGGSLDFGTVRIGDSAELPLDISNEGDDGSLLKGTVVGATGDFFAGSGSQFLLLKDPAAETAGLSDSIMQPVEYTPTDHGEDNQTIEVHWEGTPHPIKLTGDGVGPSFHSSVTPGGEIDFGELNVSESDMTSISIANLTTDISSDDELVGLTILDAFLTEFDSPHFELSDFTPGTVLGKGESLTLDVSFTAHDDRMAHELEHEESPFFHPTTMGLKTAVLNIVTDQNALFGEVGDVFQFFFTATVVPEPAALWLLVCGALGTTAHIRMRRHRPSYRNELPQPALPPWTRASEATGRVSGSLLR